MDLDDSWSMEIFAKIEIFTKFLEVGKFKKKQFK